MLQMRVDLALKYGLFNDMGSQWLPRFSRVTLFSDMYARGCSCSIYMTWNLPLWTVYP